MFLQLGHTKTTVFSDSQNLILECYKLTKEFPTEEKYAIVQQIRRAALSVHLNIAEGSSRKSLPERKRFYEIARGSVIEIDTAFDVSYKLNYCSIESMTVLGNLIVSCFKQLSALISSDINKGRSA